MDIWHVDIPFINNGVVLATEPSIRLWRMDAGNFRVIEQGAYHPILDNYSYILLHRKYAPVFELLKGQIKIHPVTIHDFVKQSQNSMYVELEIAHSFDSGSIKTVESSGKKVWRCHDSLFVSGELKEELKKMAKGELEFYLGFSFFGG